MQLSRYQSAVARTMNHSLSQPSALSNYALGLAGEAGEVIEPVKKHLYHGRALDLTNMAEELADVVWYVSALANTLGINLDEALQKNIEKLQARHPDGFKPGGAK